VSEPKIVASAKDMKKAQDRTKAEPVERAQAWRPLGWAAIAFLIVGGSDFALTWYPAMFGNREWEFGTVTATFNGLPIVVLGITLLLAASVQTRRRWWSGLVAVAAFVMLVWVLAAAVLWATNVPLALQAVPGNLAQGLKKAMVKTTIQAVVYPVLLAYLFWKAQRAMRGATAAES